MRKRGTQVKRGEVAINRYLSTITLNVNRLKAPIKRHRVAEWIRKNDLHYAAYKDPPQNQGPILTESEQLEENIPS